MKAYFAQWIDNSVSTSLHLLLCFGTGLQNKRFILSSGVFVPKNCIFSEKQVADLSESQLKK